MVTGPAIVPVPDKIAALPLARSPTTTGAPPVAEPLVLVTRSVPLLTVIGERKVEAELARDGECAAAGDRQRLGGGAGERAAITYRIAAEADLQIGGVGEIDRSRPDAAVQPADRGRHDNARRGTRNIQDAGRIQRHRAGAEHSAGFIIS